MNPRLKQLKTVLLPKFKPLHLEGPIILPRPYPSHFLSRLIRPLLEKKALRTILGFHLATAMLIVPAMSQTSLELVTANLDHPSLSDAVNLDTANATVTTETRPYIYPVSRIRFLGQNFHTGHPGWDLDAYVSDPVLAFSAGKVVKIESTFFGYGKHVEIDHGGGLTSLYAHLKTVTVQVNQNVTAGDEIGEVGMTGWTTGPHVHFEIRDNGIAVNPVQFLPLPDTRLAAK
jgi:murein DD-endopeptidase MepM/ murein hydrolase activator NlpD